MADRYTGMDLKQLQDEANRRGISIRAKNQDQLRTALRQGDATGTSVPTAPAISPVTLPPGTTTTTTSSTTPSGTTITSTTTTKSFWKRFIEWLKEN